MLNDSLKGCFGPPFGRHLTGRLGHSTQGFLVLGEPSIVARGHSLPSMS